MARLVFHTNCLLEGNQQAMETFRNGMVEQDNNGNIRPKSSPAELALYHAVQRQAQQIQENQKKILPKAALKHGQKMQRID